ncbi:MAG: tetratricopeptide repeat protein, partial [Proteobacteria bacterium]|nr:tetratricopeptide repeat protein [Pseudomonadota bacterium]
MDESGDQNTKIDGDNNSVTNKLHNHYPSPFMKITPEQYERNVELERKDAIEEHTKASDAEKVKLEQKIAELNRRLADVPKAFEELQKTNAELVSRLEQMEGKVAEKKFQKAVDAFNENEFAKADKILMEIEETEKLDKQNFGDIAYARGKIAEQEIRWKDAAEHYTRAAQLNPCFENLISAQKLTFDAGDYDSALSLGLDAQKAAIKKHGEKSEQYANILNNLASVYLIQKQYKGAESLFKEALKLHQDIFGKKTPEVALSLNNLGGIYQEHRQCL